MSTLEKNRIKDKAVQYGDYVKAYGFRYGHEEDVRENLLKMKKQSEQVLMDAEQDINDYIVEFVFKQGWENINGMIGNTKNDDNAIPYYTVGWKAAKKD